MRVRIGDIPNTKLVSNKESPGAQTQPILSLIKMNYRSDLRAAVRVLGFRDPSEIPTLSKP